MTQRKEPTERARSLTISLSQQDFGKLKELQPRLDAKSLSATISLLIRFKAREIAHIDAQPVQLMPYMDDHA